MLDVRQDSINQAQMPSGELDLAVNETQNDVMTNKQVAKSKFFTPLNIMIIIATLAIIGAGTYYFINLNSDTNMKNSINESHGKIIEYAGSSKKDGSNSGSSSSKSSNSNNKPNSKSIPASKGVISSNPGLTGSTGSGSDEPEGDDEDGDKREKKLKKASSTDVASTEEEDSDDDEQEEAVNPDQGIYWVDSNLEGNTSPLVGTSRP